MPVVKKNYKWFGHSADLQYIVSLYSDVMNSSLLFVLIANDRCESWLHVPQTRPVSPVFKEARRYMLLWMTIDEDGEWLRGRQEVSNRHCELVIKKKLINGWKCYSGSTTSTLFWICSFCFGSYQKKNDFSVAPCIYIFYKHLIRFTAGSVSHFVGHVLTNLHWCD